MARPSSLLLGLHALLPGASAASAAGEPPAPLVCRAPPERFVAVAWSNTCECPAPPADFCDMSLCGAFSRWRSSNSDHQAPLGVFCALDHYWSVLSGG
jgi:hypothetical protein